MRPSERQPRTSAEARQAILDALAEGNIHRQGVAAVASGLTERQVAESLPALLDDGLVVESAGVLMLDTARQAEPDPEAEAEVALTRTFKLRDWREVDDPKVEIKRGDKLAVKRALRTAGIKRERPAAISRRLDRLAAFVEEHGTEYATAGRRWNRTKADPDDRYPTRQAWHRAVQRALDCPVRRVSKFKADRHREAREAGEHVVRFAFGELFDVAEGRTTDLLDPRPDGG